MIQKMRTLQEAYNHIKEHDPHTAITLYALRRAVISGALPCVRSGKKYLVNLALLDEYLSNPTPEPLQTGGIRRIKVV